MKKMVLALLGLAAMGCGSIEHASTASSEPSRVEDQAPYDTAYMIPATLGEVKMQASHGEISTQIELKFQVPCTDAIRAMTYDFRQAADGKLELLVSTVATKHHEPGTFTCQSIRLETRKITTLGMLTADSLRLVNLTGADTDVPKTIPLNEAGVEAITPIKVDLVSVTPGASSTQVVLETPPVICIDPIAPVAYAVSQEGGRVKLAVSAFEMHDSRLVACANIKKRVTIDLPVVANEGDIDLTVVGF